MTPRSLPPRPPQPGQRQAHFSSPSHPCLPLAPLCSQREQTAAQLAAGGVLSSALHAAVQQPGSWDPQENKLPVLLSHPPGKTALNVINKRGSIKSIILRALEMQDARDQPAQPQALSVLQHFSTNCEHSARVAWSQQAGRDIKCRNIPSSTPPQLSIPNPILRQAENHSHLLLTAFAA